MDSSDTANSAIDSPTLSRNSSATSVSAILSSTPPRTAKPTKFTKMPPAKATVDFLLRLKPTMNFLAIDEQARDICVSCRLASTAVTLFRVGRGEDACEVGQLGVDLLGKQAWQECLVGYLETEEVPEAMEWVSSLLWEVAAILEPVEKGGSVRLQEMLSRAVGRGE